MAYKTAQEAFWAGEFGDAYMERCQGQSLIATRVALWTKILAHCAPIRSVVEFGANIGLNMMAFRSLLPQVRLEAVEINAKAAAQLRRIEGVAVHEGSLLQFEPREPADLAFTCTVLIHIAPEELPRAYAQLDRAAGRYAVICEYYNPSPVAVSYRGHTERLFKRDFAGEFMDAYPQFALVDYGFQYHRDPNFPVDDFNWFLMERRPTVPK